MSKSAEIIKAPEMKEGKGAKVKRAFPNREVSQVNPFILLDEFFVEPPAGFPEHPHSGFEAITYMLEGAFEHEDNSGATGRIETGEVQHMITGSGIRHSEFPGTNGLNHGLQLWIDLPDELKDMSPQYSSFKRNEIPIEKTESVTIRTIIGEGSPVEVHTPVQYIYVTVKQGGEFSWKIKEGYNGFLYCVSGNGTYEQDIDFDGGTLLLFERRQIKIRSNTEMEFAVISGEPL